MSQGKFWKCFYDGDDDDGDNNDDGNDGDDNDDEDGEKSNQRKCAAPAHNQRSK